MYIQLGFGVSSPFWAYTKVFFNRHPSSDPSDSMIFVSYIGNINGIWNTNCFHSECPLNKIRQRQICFNAKCFTVYNCLNKLSQHWVFHSTKRWVPLNFTQHWRVIHPGATLDTLPQASEKSSAWETALLLRGCLAGVRKEKIQEKACWIRFYMILVYLKVLWSI